MKVVCRPGHVTTFPVDTTAAEISAGDLVTLDPSGYVVKAEANNALGVATVTVLGEFENFAEECRKAAEDDDEDEDEPTG